MGPPEASEAETGDKAKAEAETKAKAETEAKAEAKAEANAERLRQRPRCPPHEEKNSSWEEASRPPCSQKILPYPRWWFNC